ncbi:MAG TPA: flotillin domain-containing protein [Burkholderiales bacterium]|nr:flotillin domain-containing protein [Burkholderiales bacterium]
MTGAQFGTFILGLIGVAIVVAIVVWLLHWLYLRSSKERAFVRTGLGGQKVVMNGGALVLPIVHEVIPVNMNTLRLEVSRGRERALITKDRMRVDVVAEFYVRVQAAVDAIAAAAQTLGQRTMQPDALKELVEGKFVDALRTVAAEMTMEEMHEKRGEYVKRVRGVVAADLLQNGLELETVSLTQLDQTAMEFFNPSNAFDAEGLTRLTDEIERRKKVRNDIEQDTMIQIRNKNLETERQALDIDRELEYARLTQERELEVKRAGQRADVARERADKEQEAERAQIASREAIDRARILSERAVEEERIGRERDVQALEIERRKTIELAEQGRAIAFAEQSKAQSEAQAAADKARALAATEEERVFTARETEMAERRKRIDLISAAQEAERDALRLKVAAQAEKSAANDRGAAVRAEAEASADAEKIRALAARIRHEVEAEGQRLMNQAANLLTPDARMSAMRLRLIDNMEAIIRESGRPLERIEGIKILQVDGLGGGGGGRSEGFDGGGSFADNVVNSALRYRAQAPLVDQLLREIGIDSGDVGKLARGLLDRQGGGAPALADAPVKSGTGRE